MRHQEYVHRDGDETDVPFKKGTGAKYKANRK